MGDDGWSRGGPTDSRASHECPKCASHSYDVGELRAAGGFWSKIFDVQGKRFTTVTCGRCRYTEIYKAETSMLGSLFRFLQELTRRPESTVGLDPAPRPDR